MRAQQKRLFTDLLEGVPSVLFILIWRQTGDIQTAGWLSAAAALGMFAVLLFARVRMHPVLLGVNLHILLITPLIEGLYRAGADPLAQALAANAYPGVLASVFLAGVGQFLFMKDRFSALASVSRAQQTRYSLTMLVVCAAGAVWALFAASDPLVPVVVTLTVLILGRNFVAARHADASGTAALAIGSAGQVKGSQSVPETIV